LPGRGGLGKLKFRNALSTAEQLVLGNIKMKNMKWPLPFVVSRELNLRGAT